MDERVMRLISRAINAETFSIKLYVGIAKNLKGLGMAAVADSFMEVAETEMHHLATWLDFMSALGGYAEVPNMEIPKLSMEKTLEQGLREAVTAEEDGIAIYQEGRELGDEIGYVALTIQCENYLLEEEGHRQEFVKLLAGLNLREEYDGELADPS